jgi:magnesium-transporting ATPase (P-type)
MLHMVGVIKLVVQVCLPGSLYVCTDTADIMTCGCASQARQHCMPYTQLHQITGDAAATAVAIARQVGINNTTADLDSVRPFLKDVNKDNSVNASINSNGTAIIRSEKVTAMELHDSVLTTSGRKLQLPAITATLATAAYASSKGDSIRMYPTTTTTTAIVATSTAVLVHGAELDALPKAGWDFIFKHKEMVFSRTTPEQKLEIVKQAQRRGDRVGVTGDGVNDSPALKRADVGIAMASGSDLARDAADIVLLSDDFPAVAHGVREGRLIFANLRKVIGYQISAGCWSELLPVLATFFLGMPQPLSSFLMIIISCVTDAFAGVALTNEPPESGIMQKPPRNVRTQRLIDAQLVGYAYFFYANVLSIGAFVNYFSYMRSRGPVVPTEQQLTVDASDFPLGTQCFPAYTLAP